MRNTKFLPLKELVTSYLQLCPGCGILLFQYNYEFVGFKYLISWIYYYF